MLQCCLHHVFKCHTVQGSMLRDMLVSTQHASAGDYGSDYGDDGYTGAAPNAIMESIQEESSPANSTRSMQTRPSNKFNATSLEPMKESVSPRQSDFGARRGPEFGAKAVAAQPQVVAPGKATKYDADGFLVDSDEEGEDKVQPLRPTPAAPPSEYEEVYDSSPAPSLTASPRVQDSPREASSTFGGAYARQQQQQSTAESGPNRVLAKQISQLAEEESDEDDFLAAAVAAVEAQDRGKPLPAKHAQQQQQQQAMPAVQTPQPASPFSRGPQPVQQPQQAEPFMSEDDDFAPQQNQSQQSRQSIPPPIPKVWQRPSAQPVVDTEDAPQRSEQSLRARYGGNKPAAATKNDASSAAAAFFAARTGSGKVQEQGRPEGANMQSMSSRPLLGDEAHPQQSSQRPPGPVPIARPPTSAYGANGPAPAGAAAAPRPTSQWFRSKPAVPPPAPTPNQGLPSSNGAYVNPFDSPKAGGQLSPMALANQQQQEQQQQRPQQEAGMFMDESDEEDQYPQGRTGLQQPQQQTGIRGAIVAGASGEQV